MNFKTTFCLIISGLFLTSPVVHGSSMNESMEEKLPAPQESQSYLIATATSGVGQAISHELAACGHSLVLLGRDQAKLELLKTKLIPVSSHQHDSIIVDYADVSSIQKLATDIKKKINGVVIIPPRLGGTLYTKDFPSRDEWQEVFNLGFISMLEIIQQSIPFIEKGGSIVVMGGISSAYYLPNYRNMNVLRKMWSAEIKNLVHTLGDKKIRANLISPSLILTEYQVNKIQGKAALSQTTFEEQLEEGTKSIPLQRYGEPTDIAKSVSFLLSKDSKHINGINLVVDGGESKAY